MSDESPVADLVGPDLRLLFVGINPSIMSAETGLHFAHPVNRFYPALRAAGILPDDVLTPADAAPPLAGTRSFVALERGFAAARPSGFARPVVTFAAEGTAFRTAFGDRRARIGRQMNRSATPSCGSCPTRAA